MNSSQNKTIRRVAVFAPNKRFFGAVIVSIPFFRALRELFPDSEIDIFSPREEFGMIKDLSLADSLVIHNIRGGLRGIFSTAKRLRKGRYDLLICMRRESLRDRLIALFSGIRERIGFFRGKSLLVFKRSIPYDKKRYRALNYLNLTGLLGEKNILEYYSDLYPIEKKREFVWILPCGSDSGKLWPQENYASLAEHITSELGLKALFITGPGEDDSFFREKFKDNEKVAFKKNASVEELLREVSTAASAVGNDCGPGHIAQISGVKTLILFAAGRNVNEWVNTEKGSLPLISDGPVEDIAVEKVFRRLSLFLEN